MKTINANNKNMFYDPEVLNHNIVTQEGVNNCLHYIDESKKERFLEIMKETHYIG
jgi:hypothetical protein